MTVIPMRSRVKFKADFSTWLRGNTYFVDTPTMFDPEREGAGYVGIQPLNHSGKPRYAYVDDLIVIHDEEEE